MRSRLQLVVPSAHLDQRKPDEGFPPLASLIYFVLPQYRERWPLLPGPHAPAYQIRPEYRAQNSKIKGYAATAFPFTENPKR